MKKIITTLTILFSSQFIFAQDVHFSQFFASPLLVNPANTGNFNGVARIGLNYRDQWGSVTVPYRTFSTYADFGIQPKKAVNRFGIGLNAFNDEAGDGILTTQKAYLTAAYHIGFTDKDYWRLAFGMAGGYVQKKVNIDLLTFDSQWNDHEFDAGLSNNETIVDNEINYLDFGAGALLTFLPWEGERYSFGFSAWHITEPQETFFDNDNTVGIKYTLTAAAFLASAGIASFQPQILISEQKNAMEIMAGTNVSFPVNPESDQPTSIFMGGWYRYADAVWIVGGAMVGNFTGSLSYDMNISKLAPASFGRGAFEIALVYTFNDREKKDPLKCPAYE